MGDANLEDQSGPYVQNKLPRECPSRRKTLSEFKVGMFRSEKLVGFDDGEAYAVTN